MTQYLDDAYAALNRVQEAIDDNHRQRDERIALGEICRIKADIAALREKLGA